MLRLSKGPNAKNKIQDNHYPIPVDLIKTCAVKTLWEKHLLSGKRVPTPTIPKSDQKQIKSSNKLK